MADEFDRFTDGDRQETIQAQAQSDEMISLLRVSGEAMLEFFLGEQLEFEVPAIHTEIWDLLTDRQKERLLLAIPRGHAKTTLAKLAVIWYFLFTPYRFCVYLSNTNAIAKNACRDIIQFMNHNNFISTFGSIRMLKDSETESIWMFEMNMPEGKRKRCILRALGANQQIRGLNIDNERPDIAIADDVEDVENTNTPGAQKSLDRWVFGTFLKALGNRTKLIWIGNMISKTSLLARLSERPNWNPVVFGCLVADKETNEIRPLWADLWPVEKIIADYREYQDLGLGETWMCEMMNMPGHSKNGWNLSSMRYMPVPTPDSLLATFITIDPAFGLVKDTNDKTAIVVHGIQDDGPPMVLAHLHAHLSEEQIFDGALMFSHIWNSWVWGIESIAAQSVLFTLFRLYCALRGLIGVIEFVELYSGRGDPKAGRIQAWVTLMVGGNYAVPEGDTEITAQLLAYDKTKKQQADDLIDGCSYGPQMLERYIGLIMSIAEQTREERMKPRDVQQGMEVARV